MNLVENAVVPRLNPPEIFRLLELHHSRRAGIICHRIDFSSNALLVGF